MLSNFYFPDLRPRLERFIAARESINKILADHKRAYKQSDTDGERWFKPFHEAMLELNHAAEAFKQAVIAEAVKLAQAERLWPPSLTLAAARARTERLLRRKSL